jgi:FtsZ-interacting cell division protein ZipA
LLRVVRCLLFVVCCLLVVGCWLLVVVVCLLFEARFEGRQPRKGSSAQHPQKSMHPHQGNAHDQAKRTAEPAHMDTTWVDDTRSNSQPNQVRQQRQNHMKPISHATAEGQISRTSCTKPHAGGSSTRKHTQEHMHRLQKVKSPHSRLHTGGPCASFSHQERPSKRASQRKPNAALRKAADGLVTTPETAHAHRATCHALQSCAKQQMV